MPDRAHAVTSSGIPFSVIPAKAGIHPSTAPAAAMDSRFRGNDEEEIVNRATLSRGAEDKSVTPEQGLSPEPTH
jgi:hypothetical protein